MHLQACAVAELPTTLYPLYGILHNVIPIEHFMNATFSHYLLFFTVQFQMKFLRMLQ